MAEQLPEPVDTSAAHRSLDGGPVPAAGMPGAPGVRGAPMDARSLLAMGERALYVEGNLRAARSWCGRAYLRAEQVGQPAVMAAAAVAMGGLRVHEHRRLIDAAGVAARQRRALALVHPRSSLALRLRARLTAEAEYRTGRCEGVLAIVDEARRHGDPVVLADALALAHHCLLGPEHARTRLQLAVDLLREGARTRRPSDALLGLLWRTADLFALGDRQALRSFAELETAARIGGGHAVVAFVVAAMRVMLAVRAGRLERAEALAATCEERGRVAGDADSTGWHGAQLVTIRWYQGRIGEVAGPLAELAYSPTLSATDNGLLAALGLAAAVTGDRPRAAGTLAQLRGDGLADLPRSSSWLSTMGAITETAAWLGDADTAAEVYPLLLPHAALPMVGGPGAVCLGSVQQALGVAALVIGDTDRAVEHLNAAVEDNTALGHWPALAISRHRLGQALAARCGPGDLRAARAAQDQAAADAALLRVVLPALDLGGAGAAAVGWRSRPVTCVRRGRQWYLSLGERSVLLPDSVGLRHLAVLIANPGAEIAAIELARPGAAREAGEPDTGAGPPGQDVLDEVAVRRYRSRLRELRDRLRWLESEPGGADPAVAGRARAEADWLSDELRRATGLGGRTRHFADNAERARIAAGKAIRRALDRVSAADPVVGEVLRAGVSTGMRCSYRPVR
jgi:hypothetical protein